LLWIPQPIEIHSMHRMSVCMQMCMNTCVMYMYLRMHAYVFMSASINQVFVYGWRNIPSDTDAEGT